MAWVPIPIGLAVLRFANTEPAEPALEGALAPPAFVVVYALPGLFALAAARRRPALSLGAAILYSLLAFTSMAGATFPLFIPGAVAFTAYAHRAGELQGRLADPIVALVGTVLGFGCFIEMLAHLSDVTTPVEAVTMIITSILVLWLVFVLAAPRGKTLASLPSDTSDG